MMHSTSYAHAVPDSDSHSPPPDRRHAADVTATVIRNDWVNDEYKHLVTRAPAPAPSAAAGQFFQLACPHAGEDKPYFRRPMSIYRADSASGEVEFLYKVTGAGTRGLAALSAGGTLKMLGPLGVGFTLEPHWRNIVVLGRGVGLATLAPLAEAALQGRVGVTAIISARGPAQLMSVDRFLDAGAHVEVVVDSDGSSDPDNVERLLRNLYAQNRADAFFTCGSDRLMRLMQRLGQELGSPGQVALEQQMACGLGMCFCCVRNFRTRSGVVSRRVCWDGPVFDLKEPLSW
jgi:dihydroorotate dehydrogenase electron transfer subunit